MGILQPCRRPHLDSAPCTSFPPDFKACSNLHSVPGTLCSRLLHSPSLCLEPLPLRPSLAFRLDILASETPFLNLHLGIRGSCHMLLQHARLLLPLAPVLICSCQAREGGGQNHICTALSPAPYSLLNGLTTERKERRGSKTRQIARHLLAQSPCRGLNASPKIYTLKPNPQGYSIRSEA